MPRAAVAVVAGDPVLATLAALVEAALSDAGVPLVERGELGRMFQEHELSAAGLADRSAVVRAGQLLGARAFVLLSLAEAPRAGGDAEGLPRVRVSETSP